jgi:hypothetical protein
MFLPGAKFFKPETRLAYTDYTPPGPWTDGQQVTRNYDGVGFTYSALLNTLTVNPNKSVSIKDANSFIIQNLPAPSVGGDAANKTYVDAHAGGGGGVPGGTSGQIQFNNASVFGGFTMSGDATVNTSTGTIALATVNSNIGTYQGLTVNAKGLVTAAVNQGYLTGNQTITLSGDITGSGATAITATLATVNANVGTFQGITVNAKGLVTAAVAQGYLTANQTITYSGDVTGSGTTVVTLTIATGVVSNSKLSPAGAYTLKGNTSGSIAAPGDFTIGGLTAKSSPVGTDQLLLQDNAASGALKSVPWSSLPTTAATIVRGALHGLTLSTGGGSTLFSTAVGQATDSTFVDTLTLSSSWQKNATAAFAAGNGNFGSLDTGAIATNTWYYVFIIKGSSGVEILTSLSATAPTLPTGYNTVFRRIGAIRIIAGPVIQTFFQFGDDFLWATTAYDANNQNVTATATLITLLVPPLANVKALFHAAYTCSAIANALYLWSPLVGSTAPNLYSLANPVVSQVCAGDFQVLVNTSGQIYAQCVSGAVTNGVYIATYGWIDKRGRVQ